MALAFGLILAGARGDGATRDCNMLTTSACAARARAAAFQSAVSMGRDTRSNHTLECWPISRAGNTAMQARLVLAMARHPLCVATNVAR